MVASIASVESGHLINSTVTFTNVTLSNNTAKGLRLTGEVPVKWADVQA